MVRGARAPVLLTAAIVALLATPAISAPSLAAASGTCVTAQVDAPFRLPDGVVHPAGVLTLCDAKTFSPVADQHLILVDGGSVGIFLSSNRRTEEGRSARPEVVFERTRRGYLDLVGYILPASGGSIAYRLKGRGDTGTGGGSGVARGGGVRPPNAILAAGLR